MVVPAAGAPARIEPVLVDAPGAGEVRVRVVANGVCHSDLWAIANGNWGVPFPMLLGHEGAGVVESVGEGVAHLEPGDEVLLAWAVPCGTCEACMRGRPRRCGHGWVQPPRVANAEGVAHLEPGDEVLLAWAVPCGTCEACTRGRPRRCGHGWVQPPRVANAEGAELRGTLSIGSLATHTVVHAAQAIPVPKGLSLAHACLLGCGASTGLGAALNTAPVRADDTVAVIGLGGIGLSALQGARLAGAERVIAVDRVATKLEMAERLGATDVVDALVEDPVEAVRAATDGGVDVAFEATGHAAVVSQAVAMLRRAGTAVAIGVPAPDSTVTLDWGEATPGAAYPTKATLKVTDGGDPLAQDFEAWMDAAVDGRLDLGSMVSVEAPFTDEALTEAFRAMLAGEVIRTVICFD